MIRNVVLYVILTFFDVILVRSAVRDGNAVFYTNTWAVRLSKNEDGVLDKLRIVEGFEIIQQEHPIGELHIIIHKRHPRKGKYGNKHLTNILLKYEGILWAEQISMNPIELNSVRCPGKSGRSNYEGLLNDKLFLDQWYLQDCRTDRYQTPCDLNVVPVWHYYKIFGNGIKVVVVDGGIQVDHPDLKINFDPEYECEVRGDVSTISTKEKKERQNHGTNIAGVIGMQANNKVFGAGIAPLVTLGAVGLLRDGWIASTYTRAQALGFKVKSVDISNNSWGHPDDGMYFESINHVVQCALNDGITQGRQSKGIIYLFSSGNGKELGDSCAHAPLTNSMYTITVGGVKRDGSTVRYSERCSNILVAAYSGDAHFIFGGDISTTHPGSSCSNSFHGTSAAVPMVAGIVTLILEARYDISWREVHHVFAWTSQVAALAHNQVWFRNKAGFYCSLDFGFGLADAFQAVTFAKTMIPISPMNSCVFAIKMGLPAKDDDTFDRKHALRIRISVNGCKNLPSEVNYMEHVQLTVSVQHRRRGAIQILLISPSGTKSLLMDNRRLDKSSFGLHNWILDTVHFWGESPQGVWTVIFYDTISQKDYHGTVQRVILSIHGTKDKPSHYKSTRTYYKFA